MYTREDYVKHETVAFTIQKDDKYLIFYHSKYNKWTIPIGKFDIVKEKPIDALCREAFEELNILVEGCIPLECRYIVYDLDDKKVISNLFLFKILKYSNYPINKEPEKHSHMFWMTKQEISELSNISESTKVFLEVSK